MNPVDEWKELLGLRRDVEVARIVGCNRTRVSEWRRPAERGGGMYAEAVLELWLYARTRGLAPSERLLRSYRRRHKEVQARAPSEIAA